MDSKGLAHAHHDDSNKAETLCPSTVESLQQIICELLIKNQQLRASLIAEQSKRSSPPASPKQL